MLKIKEKNVYGLLGFHYKDYNGNTSYTYSKISIEKIKTLDKSGFVILLDWWSDEKTKFISVTYKCKSNKKNIVLTLEDFLLLGRPSTLLEKTVTFIKPVQ